jgi:hypothetical protein
VGCQTRRSPGRAAHEISDGHQREHGEVSIADLSIPSLGYWHEAAVRKCPAPLDGSISVVDLGVHALAETCALNTSLPHNLAYRIVAARLEFTEVETNR